MSTLPIGLGVYPSAVLNDAQLAIVRPGVPILVMGTPSDERHGIAIELRNLGCDVTRRHWEPDNQQLDFSKPAVTEAARWYSLILGGLSPAQFLNIYNRAVGPNEMYGDASKFPWLATFELALCQNLHHVGIAYAWGSIQVGNVDAIPFATTFAKVNAEADAVCYHMYIAPGHDTLELADVPWYALRPWSWFFECQKRGVRFPPLLSGESGTYYPWHPGFSSAEYVTLLGQISDLLARWRSARLPVIGHCAFALGAEGTMGDQWNLDHDALGLIGAHNRGADVDYSQPQAFPQGGPPVPSLYFSPNHGGPRSQTLGIVIHATLGGSPNPLTEYNATRSWFASPASQVSAHAVVGPSDGLGGRIAFPVDPANEAWHCRASNATHLGIEMCKAKVSDPILPEILDVSARIVAGWCKTYTIPIVWSTTHGIEEHRNMPSNVDGHADVGGPFDRADFLARVQHYAGGNDLTADQKKAVLDDLDFLWSYSKATETVKNPAESEKIIHERIVALKVTLKLQ